MRPKLTYANVISTLCLFLLLGGSAFAAAQLEKNSVGTKQIRNGAINTAKLKNSAVTIAKVGKGAISSTKLRDNAVNGAKVQDGSLTGADIDQSSLTGVRAANVSGILIKGDGSCSPQVPFPSGVNAEHVAQGICSLTFPSSVADCAATATVGGSLPVAQDRTAQTFREAKLPNRIRVITYQDTTLHDLAFDLVLVC